MAVQLAGCGGSSESEGTTPESTQAKAATDDDSPAFGPEGKRWLGAAVAARAQNQRGWDRMKQAAGPLAPRLVFPHGPPPREVVFKNLRVGKGPRLETGDRFGATYSAFNYRTGEVELVSDRQVPQYVYRRNEIVKGWTPGLKGMRLGGRRELILPSNWAYRGGALVYLVKLVKVERASSPRPG